MEKLITQTREAFELHFGVCPDHIFLSPGRINIIGEHLDYNDGFVLPAAIDKYICFGVRKNSGSASCRMLSLDFDEYFSFEASTIPDVWPTWAGYMVGVVAGIRELDKKIGGIDIVFKGNIPMGAGLSSSAALECGFATVLNGIFNLQLSKKEIALLCQRSENNFVGVNCGIMDQFASVFGKKDKVMMLNCDSLEYQYYNAELTDYNFILFDSCVKHSHLSSGYNERRNEIENGKKIIKNKFPEIKSFRDCTHEMLRTTREELGEIPYKRCLYVIEEMNRVVKAADALKNQDLKLLGKLLTETHLGLSQLYEVSCHELDFLVDGALKLEGVLGARMMGGGFGGCSINLIKKDKEKFIIEQMKLRYHNAYGISLKAYNVNISDGSKEYLKNETDL
ncbi:galactokinase [Chryseobacterium phosphatilyticum]|uniref:Galactokinase n=1 Tax=Chryseobacterium phosphatilyticum TaxID=475075 RepID=A0A316WRW9_9FLAO|nr:galactokinase [Chryseobacterium phosphatilyticum]PWN61978.1 galactokinase [Chryseobacterium phosphatilyticum]